MTNSNLRQELAATTARLIAEEGLDYSRAKRKAIKLYFGSKNAPKDILPDNQEIELALREYLDLFQSETQPQRLLHLRKIALELLQKFQSYNPYVTGAVWNGTATDFSEIIIQCFTEDAKDLQIELLNQQIDFDVLERPHYRDRSKSVEALHFLWHNEDVILVLYSSIDNRGSQRQGQEPERGNYAALQHKIQQQEVSCID